MTTLTIHEHPATPDQVIVRCGNDGNELMGRLGCARLSAEHRGYMLAAEHLPLLRRLASSGKATLLDQRSGGTAIPGHVVDPLPECASCGIPRRRNVVGPDGVVTPVSPPRFCANCGDAWVDHHHRPDREALAKGACPRCGHPQPAGYRHCARCGVAMATVVPAPIAEPMFDDSRAPVTAGEALAALELVAAKGSKLSAGQAAINARGMAMVRESIRMAAPVADPVSVETARTVTCPWCEAAPDRPCVTEHRLVLGAVHAIRFEFAAGVNA